MKPINPSVAERVLLNSGRAREASIIDSATFTNGTANRYLLSMPAGYQPQIRLLAGANDPGIAMIGGRKYLQVERAATNLQRYSDTFASWTPSAAAVAVATGSTSPIGTASAKGEDNSAAESSYYYATANVPSDTNYYSYSVFIKKDNYRWLWWSLFATGYSDRKMHIDLDTPDKAETNVVGRIVNAGGGWLRISMYAANASVANIRQFLYPAAATSLVATGNAAVGKMDFWKSQVELGTYPTSMIDVPGTSSVTRAKDQAYIDAAAVPSAMRDAIIAYPIPRYNDTQLTLAGTSNYLFKFADSGSADWGLYFKAADKKLYLEIGGSDVAASDALTITANSTPVVVADRTAGTIVLSGFAAGDGTVSTSPWGAADGHLYLGQDDATGNQLDGLISVG